MKAILVALLMAFALPAQALQARNLISEAEDLYQSLKAGEPEKIPVTLRLADLLFDAAIEIDSDAKSTAAESRQADAHRARAELLYKEVLPKLNPEQALRVKFQLARLYLFKAQVPSAIALWRDIVKSKGNAKIRREAALHLAEQLELSNSNPAIREASDLYKNALPLADTDSLESYILYRSAWAHYRLGEARVGAGLLQRSLEKAHDKERDELMRDLVLFLSRDEKPAIEQLELVENLEVKYGRKGFQAQLADAYMAADRKGDYALALSELNRREPNLERAVNILDAAHDGLTLARVDEELEKVMALRRSGVTFKDDKAEKRSRDKLFRLVHLWDGNRRAGKKGYSELLAEGVSAMILLFPTADETSKALSGWLAAHPNPNIQLPQVEKWIGLSREVNVRPLEIRLTQNKLELARQKKDWQMVVVVSKELEALTAAQARPVRYQRAKALYELKDYATALPMFLELANEKVTTKDDFGKLSQDLALDILAIQKDFAQIALWTDRWQKGAGERAPELMAMGEKARFEGAVQKQDGSSLETFTRYCLEKKFLPLSCDNARSLASQLRNQATLITVLKAQGDEAELARQLEVAGRFGEAARLMEKTLKSDDRMMQMKIALLYELQGELKERDRILTSMVKTLPKQKLDDREQELVFLTLKDAGLINEKSLNLNWNEKIRTQIASLLYERDASPAAKAILAKYCGPAGMGWQKIHLTEMREINLKQEKIEFTGARSKRHFEERVALLKALGKKANCFKAGAPPELAKAALSKVGDAYAEFAAKIRETPIPDGLDEETLTEVQKQIDNMATPFEQQASAWQTSAEEIPGVVVTDGWNFDPPESAATSTQTVVFDWQPYITDIQKEPFVRGHFEDLKAHFEAKGRTRLAAYMKGRIEDMEGGGK